MRLPCRNCSKSKASTLMLHKTQEWNNPLSRMILLARDRRLLVVTRWMSRCELLWRCHALRRKRLIVQHKKRKR